MGNTEALSEPTAWGNAMPTEIEWSVFSTASGILAVSLRSLVVAKIACTWENHKGLYGGLGIWIM